MFVCVVGSGIAAACARVVGGVGIAGGGPGSVGGRNAFVALMELYVVGSIMVPNNPNVSPWSGMVIAHALRCFSKRRMWTGVGRSFSLLRLMAPFGVGKLAAASCAGVLVLVVCIVVQSNNC